MHRLDPIERLPDGTLFRLTPGSSAACAGLQSAAATFQAATACCWTAFVRSTSLEACFAGGFAAPCCPSSQSGNNPFAAPRSFAAAKSAARQYNFPRSLEIEFYLST